MEREVELEGYSDQTRGMATINISLADIVAQLSETDRSELYGKLEREMNTDRGT